MSIQIDGFPLGIFVPVVIVFLIDVLGQVIEHMLGDVLARTLDVKQHQESQKPLANNRVRTNDLLEQQLLEQQEFLREEIATLTKIQAQHLGTIEHLQGCVRELSRELWRIHNKDESRVTPPAVVPCAAVPSADVAYVTVPFPDVGLVDMSLTALYSATGYGRVPDVYRDENNENRNRANAVVVSCA